MGIQISYLKNLLLHQSANEKCLPASPYSRLPIEQWTVGENNLLMDIHVYPHQLHRSIDDSTWYWWCDAEFQPFNDSCIFATAAAFQTQATRHWIPVPSMPNGRVLMYQLPNVERIRCHIYSRTSCSVFPKLQPHPIGELVCYCGTGEVVIMGTNGDPIFQKTRDLSNAVHVYCAIANNGISFACIKRAMGSFILESHLLQSSMSTNSFIRCHNICPGFVPSRNRADGVQCKYSPDSKFIAVSSSTGFLFTVTRTKLEKQCIICPDLVQQPLSAAGAFDYNPCYPSQIITIATLDKRICNLDLNKEGILDSFEVDRHVDCIRYCPDGSRLAVAFTDFDINVFTTYDLSCIQKIHVPNLIENEIQRTHFDFQTVLNLSFSQNGEYLVSTSCDGHMRVWLIPRIFSLQELCRNSIISHVNIRNVDKLKIPTKLKNFLTYTYF